MFRLQRGERVAFLKCADRLDLEREVAVIEMVRERGVPVAAVEAFDPIGDVAGTPCVVLRDVGGEPLDGDAPAFRGAGAHLRAVHDVVIDGFGSVTVGPGLRGEDATWSQTVRAACAGLAPIVAAGLVPAELAARAGAALDDHRELFDSVESARLLHGDFHPRHVYAVDGHITGIIDWGDATAGDPVFDLGRLVRAGMRDQSVETGFELLDGRPRQLRRRAVAARRPRARSCCSTELSSACGRCTASSSRVRRGRRGGRFSARRSRSCSPRSTGADPTRVATRARASG